MENKFVDRMKNGNDVLVKGIMNLGKQILWKCSRSFRKKVIDRMTFEDASEFRDSLSEHQWKSQDEYWKWFEFATNLMNKKYAESLGKIDGELPRSEHGWYLESDD